MSSFLSFIGIYGSKMNSLGLLQAQGWICSCVEQLKSAGL